MLFSGQMLFPGPCRSEGFLYSALRLPAEHFLSPGRVRPDGGNVSLAARGEPVVQPEVVDPLECVHEFKH